MNICIISNSHAASLKSGWDSLQEHFPNIDVTFFAAPNRGMVKVKLDAGENRYVTKCPTVRKMLRMTSDGYDQIELEDYDAFLTYGLFLDVPRLDMRLSSAVVTTAVHEMVSNSVNYRFVKEIAEHTTAPIFFSPSPMPAQGIQKESGPDASYYPFEEVSGWIEGCFGHLRARMIAQSVDSLGRDCLTLDKYSTGSARLKVGGSETHADTDTRHMNELYGASFLERAIPIMRCHASIGESV